MKLEHIGIAVKNMDQANILFQKLLGKAHYKVERVAEEHVATSFFRAGETKVELLEAISEQSAISKFIAKKGEGIHHLAFTVEDIRAEIARLKGEGFLFINEEPKKGADNKLICFLHPKSTQGVLVELCQEAGPAST